MYDITRTSPETALIENFPSKSVEVPLVVPLTETLAPGRGSLLLSDTVPLIETCAIPIILTHINGFA